MYENSWFAYPSSKVHDKAQPRLLDRDFPFGFSLLWCDGILGLRKFLLDSFPRSPHFRRQLPRLKAKSINNHMVDVFPRPWKIAKLTSDSRSLSAVAFSSMVEVVSSLIMLSDSL